MGKTQRLVDLLVDSIREGQPLSVVVGASTEHARYLQNRLCQTLHEAGEQYILLKGKSRVIIGEAMIEFVSIHRIDEWRCGHCGFGEFWSDYAEWCYDRYLDKTNAEVFGN
ncbi:MAG: hypothetical protein MN733_39890 [Nitrososphaera sp.]|nr:hypothetical protein [Nitrososphaera sp.]